MQLKDLAPNEKNPRTITDEKLKQLKKALDKFGSLDGFVYNRKTKQLVGGHQRSKIFNSDTPITITKKYSKPTKTGTVAEGYILIGTDKFPYREVFWDANTEKAANIAANKGAGQWDMNQLTEWIQELNSFDVNFDLDLTMFDSEEIRSLPTAVEVSAHKRQTSKNEKPQEKEETPPKCKSGQVYVLGDSILKCGSDLKFCDLILATWAKYAGEDPILRKASNLKKTAKQPISSHA